MEEIIKKITRYAYKLLQDIYKSINGAQMKNLITSKNQDHLCYELRTIGTVVKSIHTYVVKEVRIMYTDNKKTIHSK
ncbi:hypothetical protein IMSAGC011_02254 [Lachnospiraceae bacterium]|nr:hypothetical protein IMSAGC011_02254 [Lachnospiraceae bacterium]